MQLLSSESCSFSWITASVTQGRWKNDISALLPGEVAYSARFDLQLHVIHAEGELEEELMLS